MNSKSNSKALNDRLGKMAAKERKNIVRRAAEMRQAAQTSSKSPVGTLEDWIAKLLPAEAPSGPVATVTAAEATCVRVVTPDGETTLPLAPGVRPVVGDEVEIAKGRVANVLPRRTKLAKPDDHRGGREQVLAANMDVVVVVVAAADPPFHPRLIDRYLFAIRMGGAQALICVSKMDLMLESERCELLASLDPYRSMGIEVVDVSAAAGSGLDNLRTALHGRRCAFVGHSGVGKSSLLNALLGEAALATGQVNEKTGRGRHTTTRATLHRLPNGIEVIDTPGIRAFGIDADASVEEGFPDVSALAATCRFRDCKHVEEDGCAVKEAVREGGLARERYKAYRRLMFGAPTTGGGFVCVHCGATAQGYGGGTRHRNHCPRCLWSLHLDHRPGDRLACCGGKMEPVAVWVRQDGEWAVIHRCRECGEMSSNRIAADDNEMLLLSIAARPLAKPPFPVEAVGT